jgi:hypothetical protein
MRTDDSVSILTHAAAVSQSAPDCRKPLRVGTAVRCRINRRPAELFLAVAGRGRKWKEAVLGELADLLATIVFVAALPLAGLIVIALVSWLIESLVKRRPKR